MPAYKQLQLVVNGCMEVAPDKLFINLKAFMLNAPCGIAACALRQACCQHHASMSPGRGCNSIEEFVHW
jgi:hypothetical protein